MTRSRRSPTLGGVDELSNSSLDRFVLRNSHGCPFKSALGDVHHARAVRAILQLGDAFSNEVVVEPRVDSRLDLEDVLIEHGLRSVPDVRTEGGRPRNQEGTRANDVAILD